MLTNTRLEMLAIFVIIASGCAAHKSVVSSNMTSNFESASSVLKAPKVQDMVHGEPLPL